VGGPESGSLSWLAAGLAILLFLVSLGLLVRRHCDQWVFFGALVVTPLALIVLRPEALFVRHFLVAIVFYLILLGRGFAESWRRYPAFAPAIVLTVVATMLLANGASIWRLHRLGRGSYLAAVQYMAEHTPDSPIIVASDHDFRNAMLLSFYRRHLPDAKQLYYVPKTQWPPDGPEWFIRHDASAAMNPAPALTIRGHPYRLVRAFDYGGMSGCRWYVYHAGQP
jgi:hypothetical protein